MARGDLMDKTKEENDINLVISTYQAAIDLYSSLLKANDDKRDQFMRFYQSIVLSAIGFSVLTLSNELSKNNFKFDINNPIYLLIMIIFFVVLLVGFLTYQIQLKLRIYHTKYLRLMNRNRSFMLQEILDWQPEIGENLYKAWNEHIFDNHPSFFSAKGVEQGFSIFTAFINSLLFGLICVFLYVNSISQFIKLPNFLSTGLVFIISIWFLFWIQNRWVKNSLENEEKRFAVQIVQLDRGIFEKQIRNPDVA
jgi:hypothetical protein